MFNYLSNFLHIFFFYLFVHIDNLLITDILEQFLYNHLLKYSNSLQQLFFQCPIFQIIQYDKLFHNLLSHFLHLLHLASNIPIQFDSSFRICGTFNILFDILMRIALSIYLFRIYSNLMHVLCDLMNMVIWNE